MPRRRPRVVFSVALYLWDVVRALRATDGGSVDDHHFRRRRYMCVRQQRDLRGWQAVDRNGSLVVCGHLRRRMGTPVWLPH